VRLVKLETQDALLDLEFCYDGLLEYLLRLMGDKDLTLPMMRAQAWRESAFNPIAKSPTGAQGLFQFTDAAWADMDDDPTTREKEEDIFENAKRAVKLMTAHMIRYRGAPIPMPERWKFALAAFNQGAGNVRKARDLTLGMSKDPTRWDDVVPYFFQVLEQRRAGEVRGYIQAITDRLAGYLASGATS